jgi:2-oxoglutaroyl-CoA hydrolase
MAENTAKGVIETFVNGPVATVTIDRQEKRNALTMKMRSALCAAIESLDDDNTVRAIVIRGAGEIAFCAGGDIAGFLEADAQALTALHDDMSAPARCGKPVIAAVRGFCFGAGFELALACDFIVASESSIFGLPEIRLGMIPGSGGTQRLAHRIGIARTKEMTMQSQQITAREAHQWGLLSCVVPDGDWEASVESRALELAEFSPLALRTIKQVINRAEETHLSAGMKLEGLAYGLLRGSDDFREGVEAYLEKRKPVFKGK